MESRYNVPVLLLIFNRPAVTKAMFDSVRSIRPKYLYVAADGPRKDREGEKELCEKTRSVITDNIDWDCNVKTLFRTENAGLKKNVNEALDWFFENEEKGIILEDDIVGSQAFFRFCEVNLEYYKNDSRVMLITGFNHLSEWQNGQADYFFSKTGAIWGWATWKRAWEKNRRDPADWAEAKKRNVLNDILQNEEMLKFRNRIFERTFNGEVNSWAYIWTFYRFINSGLSIVPAKNLIKNIGFGEEATHTGKSDKKIEDISLFNPDYAPIKHPAFVYADIRYDNLVFDIFHKPATGVKYLVKKIRKRTNRLRKSLIRRFFS